MRYYTIVTDSSCDLPAPLLEKMGIRVVPLAVNLDGKTYFNYPDGRALALKNIMPSCGRQTGHYQCCQYVPVPYGDGGRADRRT